MKPNRRHRLISIRPWGRGFTLVELLVVILIIGLVSAATLPVVLPALSHRQVSEGARLLQGTLAGARDAALRANAPRGVRLLPDPAFPGPNPLAANRMIAIEPAPDYSTGRVSLLPEDRFVGVSGIVSISRISISESVVQSFPITQIDEPTSWYWNIRQGDKIRFDDSGRYYTIAGPLQVGAFNNGLPTNVERYVNYGDPGTVPAGVGGPPPYTPPPYALPLTPMQRAAQANNPDPTAGPAAHRPERLFLVNGQDDDGDGFVDEGFDGIDNDGDGVVDPGFNGIDDDGDNVIDNPEELFFNAGGEYEEEKFIGGQFIGDFTAQRYTIFRRPVVTEGAREVALPQGVVIDLTTWNAASAFRGNANNPTRSPSLPERSRLPVDPYSTFVDVMIAPNGQVIPSGPGVASLNSGNLGTSPTSSLPFYHFWIAEREDVVEPIWGVGSPVANPGAPPAAQVRNYVVPVGNPAYANNPSRTYLLPMPEGTTGYDPRAISASAPNIAIKGDRRLVTLFVRTGQIITNEIESFNVADTNQPYYEAQFGLRGAK